MQVDSVSRPHSQIQQQVCGPVHRGVELAKAQPSRASVQIVEDDEDLVARGLGAILEQGAQCPVACGKRHRITLKRSLEYRGEPNRKQNPWP